MFNTVKKVILISLFFYLPYQSQAWGVQGHRIVGQIAESHLNSKAKRAIKKIMGDESLAMSANWMDFIKSDSSYNYLSNWHYVNIKEGLNESQVNDFLNGDTATNVFTKVKWVVKELKNKSLPTNKKLFYLRVLVHLVGDLHQPMHTARPTNRGGNNVKVQWFNTPTNLHAVWDESLVNFQQLSYTEYASSINYATKAEKKAWQKQPLSQWIYESYQISEKIYSDIKQPDQRLSYNYNFDYLAIINQQLLKGGVRLGGLLNEIFGS